MILVIGDLHFKFNLSYSDHIKNGREEEEKEILDFIVKKSEPCNKVVLMGDLFHSRTNSPEVIRKAVEFIERFHGKEIFILKGNHDTISKGKSTLDFLKEIKETKINIITSIEKIGDFVFLPNLSKSELEVKSNEAGKKKIMKMLPDGKMLFHHYAMSGSKTNTGTLTDIFDEIVLDREELKKKYKLVIAGHIHNPQVVKNVIVTGSVFTDQVNEIEKFIWKVDESTLEVEQIKLSCREIHKLENPTNEDFDKIPRSSIIKVIFTDPKLKDKIEEIKEKLKEFDASILLENFPLKRKKVHFEEGMLEFDISQLLELYAKQKKVDIKKLVKAFELIE